MLYNIRNQRMAEVFVDVLVLSYHELRKPHLGFTQSCVGRLAPAFSVKPTQYVNNVFRIGNMISDVVIYIRIFFKSHIILVPAHWLGVEVTPRVGSDIRCSRL